MKKFFAYRFFFLIFVLLVLAIPAFTKNHANTSIEEIIKTRLAHKELKNTILGALAFLEDRQVRPRKGKKSCEYDSSTDGDGCKTLLSLNIPFRENIGLPAPKKIKANNRSGEWASYIHFLPNKIGFKGRAPAAVQDSNLFMTAFIGYPLFMFDESNRSFEDRHINKMLRLAMQNILSFKRGDAYNFWAVLPGVRGDSPRTGPFNITVKQLEMLGKAYLNPKLEKVFAVLARGQQTPPKYWIASCLNQKANPTGADALFNIPNDADDTSTAVAFQYFFRNRFPDSGVNVDLAALEKISRFRDLDRKREDGRDLWKGKNSGAYLTWLKDEKQPVFSQPEKGIIPLGVNNVDVVVNSNVLFAMALTGKKRLPGYMNCINLICEAINKKSWPEAGLYYPQNLIFPYAATRAYRDGQAREGRMRQAMKKLLKDLLKEQNRWQNAHFFKKGAFPGGDDKSDHLATALGVTSLLNIGVEIAREAGLEKQYNEAIQNGVRYLLRKVKWRKAKNKSTVGCFATPDNKVACWKSGLFFAASFWDLAHWRSQAFTVAMALEALTKYALAYEVDGCPIGKRKLKLVAPQPVKGSK
jgi:hypothetical protein